MRHAHCPRCARTVPVDAPWVGLYVIEGVLLLALLALLPLTPILLSEIFLLTPMLCVLLLGAVVGWAQVTKPASCRLCQLELPRTRKPPTP